MPEQDPRFIPDAPKDERFTPDKSPSMLGQAWDVASKPLTTKPAEWGKRFVDWFTTPTLEESPTGEGGLQDFLKSIYAKEKGLVGGGVQGVGNLASEFTSPINLAMMGLGAGEFGATKAGLPAIARLLGYGSKAASVPFAVHGAGKVLSPQSTLAERGMGLAEAAGGLAGMIHTPAGKIRLTNPADIEAAVKAGKITPGTATQLTKKYYTDKASFDAAASSTPETLVRPEVSPEVAGPIANPAQTALPGFEDIFKPSAAPVNPDSIHAAFKAGKITQPEAIRLMENFYKEEAGKTIKTTPIAETKPPIAEVAPTETPVVSENRVTYVIPKNQATPEFVNNARDRGYVFKGLTDNGDFRFKKIGPVADITKMGEPTTPIVEPPIVPKVTTTTPPSVQNAVDLITSGKIKNVAELQRETGYSFTRAKTIWYAAKKQIRDSEMPPGFFTKMGPESTGIADVPKVVENAIPPIAPLTQLPSPPGLSRAIRDIPVTGNEELDSAVASLRAMRRRKGIDQFNELETQAYTGLMDKISNHPALPENLRQDLNAILGESAILGVERPGVITRIIENEKGELIIRPGKELPKKVVLGEVPIGKVVIVKSAGATPEFVKRLYDEGFRFLDENKTGGLRFKKIETKGQAPVLESEVGAVRPTRRGAMGDLGAVQDAQKSSIVMEAFNLPRGIMASWDFSAPLRQGIGLIHKKAFWTSLDPMFRSWASEEGFRASQERIANRSLFKKRIDSTTGKKLPSFADDAGLKLTDLTDLSKREEAIMSTWAEKVPMVRASNRAYTSFLNNLRADVFESLIKDGNVLTETSRNLSLARSIADFVNTATGRGSLGKLEASATILNTGLFAPRLIASRVKILNPSYYIMAPPLVRKEALKSLFAIAAVGNTVLQLAKMAGAEVGTDPNSSDFGKAKIGNVRIDPWGGFQQYVVAANRLIRPSFAKVPGMEGGTQTGIAPLDLATGFLGAGGQSVTSSTTGREYDLWEPHGPYAPTPATVGGRFLRGKLNPVIGFAWSIFTGAKEMSGQKMDFKTMNPMDNAIAQRFIPILIQDIYQLAKENPELLPLAIPATFGMGLQTYGQQ
jgi:hypothetical protein